jgi:hypothetical protein
MCDCGESGGQYNEDLMSATVGGNCDIVGISNLFFDEEFKALSEEEKVAYRKKINHFTSEIWYGEIGCDNQIHRIKSPCGPRLEMKVEWADATHTKSTITDRRKYLICGERLKSIIIENEMIPSFKDRDHRRNKKSKNKINDGNSQDDRDFNRYFEDGNMVMLDVKRMTAYELERYKDLIGLVGTVINCSGDFHCIKGSLYTHEILWENGQCSTDKTINNKCEFNRIIGGILELEKIIKQKTKK